MLLLILGGCVATPTATVSSADPIQHCADPSSRYVFSTGVGFPFNYVQVIRQRGGATVFLDNGVITESIPDGAFTPVNDTYEVANHLIEEGTYTIESGSTFGIVQMGWTDDQPNPTCFDPVNPDPKNPIVCFSSYAYPGGMKSERINIP